ncbi:MAG: rRNA pseudouridine synthase [Ruminococcus sp.]|nr:rRNA pseudouridine synthase [Ruminococcus sp.]
MRIDKFIASQRTDLSRQDVKRLIRKGEVTLDGEKVTSPETQALADSEVLVSGEKIVYREHIYLMINKPQGYVCSTSDRDGTNVLELVPPKLRRKGLFPAGRLDKDSEGFVLVTDDGELAHKMLAPSSHVPKTYYVRLEKPFEEKYRELFAKEMSLDALDGEGMESCLPAEICSDESDECACTVVLHEGKYHQIKRMFENAGNKVVFLRRICIGNLPLEENLPLGGCLEILHKDVENLLTSKI